MSLKELFRKISAIPVRFIECRTNMLNRNSIEYWQAYSFHAAFLMVILCAIFVYIMGLFWVIHVKTYLITIIYTIALGSISYLFFFTKHSIRAKCIGICLIIYGLSTIEIYLHNKLGGAFHFLFSIVLLCSLFTDLKISLTACVLNLIILCTFALLGQAGLVHWNNIKFSFSGWLTTNFVLFFIQIMFATIISILLSGIKRTFSTLNKTKHATITGLAKLSEFRDNDTGLHLERIRDYAVLIARNLSRFKPFNNYVTLQYIDDISISSTLHDIGKVGVPDYILLKPGKLEKDEFEIMKKHPLIGKLVLEEIAKKLGDRTFLDMAECIAHYHHEKWDGTGYPNGLAGEQIPLSARIIALADVYDALTMKRIYKKSFTHKEAVELIVKEKGNHFDPMLVDLFIELESEFDKIRFIYDS